jgi:hypothetical protein
MIPSLRLRFAFLFAPALLWLGCAASSSVAPPGVFINGAVRASDGQLRYRVPRGWVDASTDSQSVRSLAWLVRADYSATITIDAVHVNPDAQDLLGNDGLLQLAQLQMGLQTHASGVDVVDAPALESQGDRTVCRYQVRSASTGDTRRTYVVGAAGRYYAITALVTRPRGTADVEKVFELQAALVRALEW